MYLLYVHTYLKSAFYFGCFQHYSKETMLLVILRNILFSLIMNYWGPFILLFIAVVHSYFIAGYCSKPQICRWYHSNGRKRRGTKESLDEGEVGEWKKNGLKLNIKKTKIMASGTIASWQIEGGKVEVVTDFLLLGSKITADGDCSHEIRKQLFLVRKAMTNLDSVLKSRVITLSTKIWIIKAMVSPVVMYSCESWTIKKAKHQRTDAFEL